MSENKHRIKAYLYENGLTKDNANDFMAKPVSERTVSISQICQSAVSRGRADLSAAVIEHATEIFLEEMAYLLCEGYSVNTGYFTANAGIHGFFGSASETFSKDRQNVIFHFHQGEKLRAVIPDIEVDILGLATPASAILQVTDVKSGSVNDLLTPSRNLSIIGTQIKIMGDDPARGIYFIDTATQAKTMVPAFDIVSNNTSELIVVIPALPAGKYHLEVITRDGEGTLLKKSQTVAFDHILTVE
ncbi:DNA-binding domain-containing protein [Chryseobacterium lineare]